MRTLALSRAHHLWLHARAVAARWSAAALLAALLLAAPLVRAQPAQPGVGAADGEAPAGQDRRYSLLGRERAKRKIKVAVMPFAAEGVEDRVARVMDTMLTTLVDAQGIFEVIGQQEINALLGFEKTKAVLGCSDMSCATEIGGALGVRYIVSGVLGRLGSRIMVTLMYIDAQELAVLRRVTYNVEHNEDVLPAALKQAVQELFAQKASAVPLLSREEQEAAERAEAARLAKLEADKLAAEQAAQEAAAKAEADRLAAEQAAREAAAKAAKDKAAADAALAKALKACKKDQACVERVKAEAAGQAPPAGAAAPSSQTPGGPAPSGPDGRPVTPAGQPASGSATPGSQRDVSGTARSTDTPGTPPSPAGQPGPAPGEGGTASAGAAAPSQPASGSQAAPRLEDQDGGPIASVTIDPPSRRGGLFYAGLASGLLGLGVSGSGLAFGMLARSAAQDVDPATYGSQLDAQPIKQRELMANVLLGAGGALVALGATLMLLDGGGEDGGLASAALVPQLAPGQVGLLAHVAW